MLAIGFASLASTALAAGSLRLYPVRIELSEGESVQMMTITNDGDETTRLQLRVFGWRHVGGEDVLEETRDILANPGLFEVKPGGTQIARFGLRTAPEATEKSYRVLLEEVPIGRPSTPGEVRTLLRISVPIFVPPAAPRVQLSWQAARAADGGIALQIRNSGNVHVQLNRLSLSRPGGTSLASEDMSVYILPGQSAAVALKTSAPVRVGEVLKLGAMTDQGERSIDLSVEAATREARP
ncbi:molecular chaperone [Sphingopyxis sp. PAMC25046]|nr:molecular chaperone [Sphingopyxis sp. PAMC25046]